MSVILGNNMSTGINGIFNSLSLRLPVSSVDYLCPDQARHFVGPDLVPNYLTLKDIFENVNFAKKADNKNHANLPAIQCDQTDETHIYLHMGLDARKPVFGDLQTT